MQCHIIKSICAMCRMDFFFCKMHAFIQNKSLGCYFCESRADLVTDIEIEHFIFCWIVMRVFIHIIIRCIEVSVILEFLAITYAIRQYVIKYELLYQTIHYWKMILEIACYYYYNVRNINYYRMTIHKTCALNWHFFPH